MRRKKAFKRGRAVSILVAGSIGYLIGSWNATAVRGTDPSAAQTVALRFPQDWNDAPAVQAAADAHAAATTAMVMGDPQPALFDPEPMVPQATVPQAAAQSAVAEAADPSPAPATAPPQPPQRAEPPSRRCRRQGSPLEKRSRRGRRRRSARPSWQPHSPIAAPIVRDSCSTTRRSPASRSDCI